MKVILSIYILFVTNTMVLGQSLRSGKIHFNKYSVILPDSSKEKIAEINTAFKTESINKDSIVKIVLVGSGKNKCYDGWPCYYKRVGS